MSGTAEIPAEYSFDSTFNLVILERTGDAAWKRNELSFGPATKPAFRHRPQRPAQGPPQPPGPQFVEPQPAEQQPIEHSFPEELAATKGEPEAIARAQSGDSAGQKSGDCTPFVCRVAHYQKTYIAFCPWVGADKEARKQLSERGYDLLYEFDSIDKGAMTEMPNGEQVALYRWNNRKWLFSRYDEGIQMSASGFLDVTPEPVARHIAAALSKLAGRVTEGLSPARPECATVAPQSVIQKLANKAKPPPKLDRAVGAATSGTEGRTVAVRIPPKLARRRALEEEAAGDDETSAVVDASVVDACCGFGGNTIQFARYFSKVVAIDSDAGRLACARNNAQVYRVGERIQWIHQDVTSWSNDELERQRGACREAHSAAYSEGDGPRLPNAQCASNVPPNGPDQSDEAHQPPFTWVFVSPPWGGSQFKHIKRFFMRTSVPGVDLFDMAVQLARVGRSLCVFLPGNQDLNEMIELAGHLPRCIAVSIEFFSIGIKKETKFIAVKYLDEDFANVAFAGLKSRISATMVKELRELPKMEADYRFLLERLGISKALKGLEEALAIDKMGGLTRSDKPGQRRSKGGVFFQVVKRDCPEVYRGLNKLRKERAKECGGCLRK